MAPRIQQLKTQRGKNFSLQEACNMVDAVANVWAVSPEEWNRVMEEHNEVWLPGRTLTLKENNSARGIH